MRTILANCRITASALRQAVRIRLMDFHRTPPVVIYQMGKVASTTVHESLRRLALPSPVYQVHFLARSGIDRARDYYRSIHAWPWPEHLVIGKALAAKLEHAPGERWKIVTLVRDPIARDISGFFQHVETSNQPLRYEGGQVARSHASGFAAELARMFSAYDESSDFACTWFDLELKAVFGVDVFAHPFRHDQGYAIIRGATADVLVLRVEDLARCLTPALREFLALGATTVAPLARTNTADERRVMNVYRDVLDNLRLGTDVCERVYASRYCRHFYRDEEIASFIARWSGRPARHPA